MSVLNACMCLILVVGASSFVAVDQSLYRPFPWNRPIGNQLSYNIRVNPPTAFDVSRYSRHLSRDFFPNLPSNQLNGFPVPPVFPPFVTGADAGDMYVGGAMERSPGISSSIDIMTPPQQRANRPFDTPPQRRYVGMVSEITNNEIGPMREDETLRENKKPQLNNSQLPGLPPFLVGTPTDVQNKFFGIVSNTDKSFKQKQSELDTMMSNMDGNRQQMYSEFRTLKDGQETARRAKIHSLVETLSPKAQAAFAKISAILTNVQLKDGERWQMIQNAYSRLDDDVKKELDQRFEGMNLS